MLINLSIIGTTKICRNKELGDRSNVYSFYLGGEEITSDFNKTAKPVKTLQVTTQKRNTNHRKEK